MTDTNAAISPRDRANRRKTLMQAMVGALVGGGATFGLLSLIGDSGFAKDDPSRVAALIAGLTFLLMGVLVGLGTLAPAAGAKWLNVAGEEDLRDQRRQLALSAAAMVLIGAAMSALALAAVEGARGIVSGDVAGMVAALAFVGAVVLAFVGRHDNDELIRAVSTESMSLAMHISFVLLGVWAALAHLGHADWIDPLGLLALLLMVQLAAIFWVSWRRGLLRQPSA